MDSDLAALASTAASTLVQLLVTDGWARAKEAVVRLWRRSRPSQADGVVTALDESHAALMHGDDATAREQAGQWRDRLTEMFTGAPELGRELSDLLSALASETHVTMSAWLTGDGRVYQAARDMTIKEG